MNKILQKYTARPSTRKELRGLVEAEIYKNGNRCDLNHIDVSLVTDFSCLFADFGLRCRVDFNGDISNWDVSSALDIECMFYGSAFNGNLSKWDVSGVKNMVNAFAGSKFNGDISKWDVSGVVDMRFMFSDSEFKGDISGWSLSSISNDSSMFFGSDLSKLLGVCDPHFEQVKSYFLAEKLEAGLRKVLPEQSGALKVRL